MNSKKSANQRPLMTESTKVIGQRIVQQLLLIKLKLLVVKEIVHRKNQSLFTHPHVIYFLLIKENNNLNKFKCNMYKCTQIQMCLVFRVFSIGKQDKSTEQDIFFVIHTTFNSMTL